MTCAKITFGWSSLLNISKRIGSHRIISGVQRGRLEGNVFWVLGARWGAPTSFSAPARVWKFAASAANGIFSPKKRKDWLSLPNHAPNFWLTLYNVFYGYCKWNNAEKNLLELTEGSVKMGTQMRLLFPLPCSPCQRMPPPRFLRSPSEPPSGTRTYRGLTSLKAACGNDRTSDIKGHQTFIVRWGHKRTNPDGWIFMVHIKPREVW